MGDKSDILVIIAHPDDEVFASGTICLCAEKGFRIALVCATDGEGGSRDLLPSKPELRLGEIRRQELMLSAHILGASEVCFLSQPDSARPDAEGEGSWDQPNLISTLGNIIRQHNPALILTHGPQGGYGHPAHRLLYRCVAAGAQAVSFDGSIFSFCGKVDGAFFSWHFDQPGDVLVDARIFLPRRAASLSYHQTQVAYFVQPHFPRSVRKLASALFGFAFSFTVAGRKRVPIATPTRFFRKFPTEGLVLQKAPDPGRAHFFREHYLNDHRVQINR
jgi:LmbE family N-acetylglucosaminyl deacetylase